MRILMLLSNPYRPDYRVKKEAGALREEGHEVSLIAWDREGIHRVKETIDGIQVFRSGPRAGYDSPLDMMIKLPIFLLRSLLRSRKLDFDVVHAHDLDTLVLGWPLARLRSVKLVYDAHELYWGMIRKSVPPWVENFVKIIEEMVVPKSDAVITVTPQVEAYLKEYGAKRPKLIMNCEDLREPDEERVREIREKLLGDASRIVLFVGMLEPSRDLEPVIDMFGELESNEVKLVIGGTGSLASKVLKLSEETENVDFIGWIRPGELLEYFSASDIIAAMTNDPSYTNIEVAISTRLFIAMAAGKPIIVTEDTEDARIVKEEDIGKVVKFRDLDETRNAILELLGDEERLNRIAENGMRAARERYNWSIMKKRLIELYRDLEASQID
ncbi:MAG: glycosyltransferase family 4 protein [Thermoplasmata archaeon]